MKPVKFTTPSLLTVIINGNRPYYRIKCNFHATNHKAFMDALEKEFFVRSIAFRESESYIHVSAGFLLSAKDVLDKLQQIVESYLP